MAGAATAKRLVEDGIAVLRVMIDGGDDDALNNVVFGHGQLPQGGSAQGTAMNPEPTAARRSEISALSARPG